jgi:hypothetical protein
VDLFASRLEPMAGSYGHGSEPSCSLKGRKFVDYLSNSQLFTDTLLHGLRNLTLMCN